MFGVVTVADEAWALLVQLEQVNAHIETLRQCFDNIRDASTNATDAKEKTTKEGGMASIHGDNGDVDEEEVSVSSFIAGMMLDTEVYEADKSDSPTGKTDTNMKLAKTEELKGNPSSNNVVGTQPVTLGSNSHDHSDSDDDSDDSDFEDLLHDVIQDARESFSLSDGAMKHVAKAAAMLAIYGDDALEDISHPELDRCVEKLREALVKAEELGMVKADLVVVTAGKELLQRFEPKPDTNPSLKSTSFASFASDKGN